MPKPRTSDEFRVDRFVWPDDALVLVEEPVAEAGRRVRRAKVEEIQGLIDELQAANDDFQSELDQFDVELEALEDLLAWATYDDVQEGGPGSGHHGHRGIPGYRGGSMSPGPISFFGRDPYSGTEHMEAYATKQSKEWLAQVEEENAKAVMTYTSSGYINMNDCLRAGKFCDGKERIDPYGGPNSPMISVTEANSRFTAALDKARVPEDTVVYRGISHRRLTKMTEGEIYKDKGFMSTTLNATKAADWQSVPVKINVPKGARGGYVQSVSAHTSEVELTLQRGTWLSFKGFEQVSFKDEQGVDVTRDMAVFDVVSQLDFSKHPDGVTVGVGKFGEVFFNEGGPGSGNWGHRGIPGSRGGSLPKSSGWGTGPINPDFFEVGPGKAMLEDVDDLVLEKTIKNALTKDGRVQYRHIEGVTFTDKPPTHEGYSDNWRSPGGYTVQGVCVYESKSIHLKPDYGSTKAVVLHELGHHVDRNTAIGQSTYGRLIHGYIEEARKLPKKDLKAMGLRNYSLKNSDELFADVYAIYSHTGADSQWANELASWLRVDTLETVFGEQPTAEADVGLSEQESRGWVDYDPARHADKKLYEIIGITTEKLTETVIVDADVSHEEASETPWYYVVWAGPGDPIGVADRSTIIKEGGPGSGHHGHRGIPGYRGGSMAPGAIQFGWKEYRSGEEEDEHIRAYAEKQSDEWLSGVSDGQEAAIRDYTASSGGINDCVRSHNLCGPRGSHRRETIDNITDALYKSEVKEDTIVYRGMSARHLPANPGEELFDRGFTSTSLNPQIGDAFKGDGALCRIKVPAGTKAGYVQRASEYKDEAELLIQRSTTYRFIGKSTIPLPEGGTREVFDLEVVQQWGSSMQISGDGL